MEKVGYELARDFNLAQLIADLELEYNLAQEKPTHETTAIFDSFDWRLYRSGCALYRQNELLTLKRVEDGVGLSSQMSSEAAAFAWDLPEGSLRSQLTPILGVRRLLELLQAKKFGLVLRVLNDDRKTVAHVLIEELRISRDEGEPLTQKSVWVLPVRGYPRYYRSLVALFAQQGYTGYRHADAYRAALAMVGRAPGDYNPKLEAVKLSPEMRADTATKEILRFTLGVMRRNEAGVKADLDTEFLHDYRVAVRRTRSALTQIKGVFPNRVVAYYKGEFAKLGVMTNPLRDLDVYLLKEDEYRGILPKALETGIDPIFEHLKEERRGALKTVESGLNSENYRALLAEWEQFLNAPPPEEDEPSVQNASMAVIELACKRIFKRYRRVIRDGEAILTDETVVENKMHALRIDCKKLRYLLEFFASLFPRDEIDLLVKQLKKLQDNLGDFNDFVVQGEYLIQILKDLSLEGEQARMALASIGGLVGHLDEEKARVQGEFAQTFRAFAAKENQKRFQKLFKDDNGGAK